MRKSILLYLFIFSLLFLIFIYINDKKILDARDAEIKDLQTQVDRMEGEKDSLAELSIKQNYFKFLGNDDAMTYFENKGLEAEKVVAKVEEELLDKNKVNTDNPYAPFPGMDGDMRINKIKILNHKWLIADFTDGKYWGEAFYTYFVLEDGTVELNLEKSFLYPTD
ncbi:hypothetical protein SAMN05444483_12511 [Salegentibacter echinorum]|uniref:Hydrolase n=1 Tax=Salegentibacter echinorum TaxID=1073325 RepID=A0A1M5M829_SALEC|nr:hypothetical protein [Salegentibacter echinorum]SHG72963.1 hypothetical protein SAMN05444483_12511 [Salegentibacter echinorum]